LEVERVIRQRAGYLGHRLPPVIKWLPDPQAAFDHLSRYRLANLLEMENATFWREAGCPVMDEETLDRRGTDRLGSRHPSRMWSISLPSWSTARTRLSG
jgi:hypothetical protein